MKHFKRFEKFTGAIADCYKYIIKLKSREMSSFGLKASHVMCLYFLGQNPEGLKARELVTLCHEDKAAISKTLANLKELGYVKTEDGMLSMLKYRKRYFITEKGIEVYHRIAEFIEDTVEKCSADLSEDELRIFYQSMDKITAKLQNLVGETESEADDSE